jgi:hypothetical protein
MAKKDQAHEHGMDKAKLFGEIFLKFAAMVMVLAVLALMVGGAIYAAQTGHESLAIAIASGTGLSMVAGVIARIVLGQKPREPQKPKPPARPRKKKG